MKWNVMMKYTNYQTPRSEWQLFYPILLMWTVKNCLKCLLNLLCNTAAMVPCSHWVIGRPCVAHSCSDLLLSSYTLGRRAELRINFSSLFQSDQETPLRIFYFSRFFMAWRGLGALYLIILEQLSPCLCTGSLMAHMVKPVITQNPCPYSFYPDVVR